jgi:hypothetical protein
MSSIIHKLSSQLFDPKTLVRSKYAFQKGRRAKQKPETDLHIVSI